MPREHPVPGRGPAERGEAGVYREGGTSRTPSPTGRVRRQVGSAVNLETGRRGRCPRRDGCGTGRVIGLRRSGQDLFNTSRALGAVGAVLRGAGKIGGAAAVSALGTEVYYVVRDLDDVQIVLYHYDGVARISQGGPGW